MPHCRFEPNESDECGSNYVLLRVVIWEKQAYADSLSEFLWASGRPFLRRPITFVPKPRRVEGAVPFELFTVPVISLQIAQLMGLRSTSSYDSSVEIADLPLLAIVRRRPPRNPKDPHRELSRRLSGLHRWRKEDCLKPISSPWSPSWKLDRN
jgi:hypothetical protein